MPCRALVVALALAGCFADAPPLEECQVGAKGCPCTGGGACDPGLECHAPSMKCFDPQCERGSIDCPCLDGQCVGDLLCLEDYCELPPPASTGAVADEASVGDPDGASDPTDPTAAAATASTDDPTMSGSVGDDSVDVETSAIGSASDDGPPTTGDPSGCLECMQDAGQAVCSMTYGDCMGDQGCNMIIECILFGNGSTVDCCVNPYGGQDTWDAFVNCASRMCPACGGMLWKCGGG
jgi:hypothetical protein